MSRLRDTSPAVGALVAAGMVLATTLAVYGLREVAPVISLGVVYLLGVLAVSAIWGRWLGVATAVASTVAFNAFHIPPTGRLTIADAQDWVALGVYLVTALVAGSLAEAARRRAEEAEDRQREAALGAELARVLLGADDLEGSLAPAAQRIAAAYGLDSMAIATTEPPHDDRREALDLDGEGWLVIPASAGTALRARLADGVVPTLATLLRAARARDALLHEVVETRALRRSEEIKTTLLRTVSHDLRTPLTAIAASAEALASPSLEPDERRDLAGGLAEQATALSELVDDLIDLSRLEAGRAEPNRTWVAVDEVLDGAAEGLPAERLDLRLDEELPLIHADPVQLERAFHNLLDNALRHSDGQPVTVRAAPVGARVVVRVTDRGPGIPVPEHERIFQPFYRADASRPRSAGSGLGLAIVRGFVEANGGTVTVESYPGQGASFVVKLPLVEGAR